MSGSVLGHSACEYLQHAARSLRRRTEEGEKRPINLFRAQELCKSRGGRPGLPVPNSPYGLRGRKTTLNSLNSSSNRAQELCESRGGRRGLPVPNSPYGLCGRRTTLNWNLNL